MTKTVFLRKQDNFLGDNMKVCVWVLNLGFSTVLSLFLGVVMRTRVCVFKLFVYLF